VASSSALYTLSGPVPVGSTATGLFSWNQLIQTLTDSDDAVDAIPPGSLDTVRTALERIYKQFEGDPDGWEALATAIGEAWRDVDSLLGDVNERRYVSTAEGVALDDLAGGIGLTRLGLTDDELRVAIRVEIASRFTSGTIPEIIEMAQTLLPGRPGALTEFFPAAFVLSFDSLTAAEFALLCAILKDTAPAGVAAMLGSTDPGLMGGWDYSTTVEPSIVPGIHGYSGGGTFYEIAPWSYVAAFGSC